MATRELRQTPIIVHKNPITIAVETTQDDTCSHRGTFTIDESYVDPDSILFKVKLPFPIDKQKPFSDYGRQGSSQHS